MLKVNKPIIGYLLLSFMLLQSLGVRMGSSFIALFMPCQLIFLLFLIFYNKSFFTELYYLYKRTPFKYLILFTIWACITVFISLMLGTFYFNSFLVGFIGGLIFSVIFTFICSYFICNNFINLKTFIKFILIFYFFVFFLGILNYISNTYSLDIIKDFLLLFNNKRSIIFSTTSTFESNRIRSIFDEPGNLGAFIYVSAPIIYSLVVNKYKIFENCFLNFVIKKGLIPLMILNLLFCCSPISLLLFLLVTFMYFYKKIFYYIKKYNLIIILMLFLIIVLMPLINLNGSYLYRIVSVFSNLGSINNLILADASFATRIINYINMFQVGVDFPITGIGYGNISKYILVKMQSTNIPLTEELLKNLYSGKGGVAAAIFYKIFAETGVIGLTLLLVFLNKIRTELNIIKKFKNIHPLEYSFINGLSCFILFQLFVRIFYDSNLHNTYEIILYSISIFIIIKYKTIFKGDNKNENNILC